MRYAKLYNTVSTPQQEPIPGKAQVQNNAGGYVFQLDVWGRLDRFLILGADSPTYYQTARELTRQNAVVVEEAFTTDFKRAIETITKVSVEGRAPKNDSAIFALALATTNSNPEVRAAAYAAVPAVCRTGTHLMQFVNMARALGKGWGRGMKRAVGNWFDAKPVDKVAYQGIKYRSREGYDYARLLRSAHPVEAVASLRGDDQRLNDRDVLYRWLIGKELPATATEKLPAVVKAHMAAMAMSDSQVKELLPLITEHRLPWEALPTWANTKPEVWQAMLPHLGMTAMIRNLGNMTKHGAIKPLSEAETVIAAKLVNEDELRRARIHPFNVLLALAVYSGGKALKGGRASHYYGSSAGSDWNPSQKIVDALNEAFYLSFKTIEPTGKRHFFGVDVSGSMSGPMGGSAVTCAQAAAALAMVGVRTEPKAYVMAFNDRLTDLKITPAMRLDDVLKKTAIWNGGGTDCALPMLYAQENGIEADVFVVITDNQTWAGRVHPSQALRAYRQKTGINAKLVVVGLTSTGFTIADPSDGGMMDFVGFDSAAPAVMADFIRK